MTAPGRPALPFILSLLGGLLVFVGSAISIVWYTFGSSAFGSFWGMMTGFHGMMGSFGLPYGYMTGFSIVGLICGIIVMISAFMLNTRPAEHVSWGALVIVFSAISFIGMGGWFIGALLGIAGGALAVSWRPR